MSEGPYRDGSAGLRFVCLACYAHASPSNGTCPTCSVDLLPLSQEGVRADLRAEAERRMQGRQYAEYFGLHLVAFLLMTPILLASAGVIFMNAIYIGSSLGVGQILRAAYTKLRPKSALALYAKRNRRLQAALANKPTPRLPAQGGVREGEGDPEEMSLQETMRWLGMPSEGERKP